MKRILVAIKFFFKVKFKSLKHKKVVIFDCVAKILPDLVSIFESLMKFLLCLQRIDKIDTIYLNWNIILFC